ncbi:MAG: hypothetical protein V4596_06320 [Bdellovibrionota bacterium]
MSPTYQDKHTEYTSRFKQCALSISAIFEKNGFKVIPFKRDDLPIFSSLSSKKQAEAIHYIELYYSILQQSEIKKSSEKNNNADSLWEALVYLQWHQPSDFFSYLRPDDKIEIYNTQSIQIWRNFNVMKICSYSIEEMHCYTWPERYSRSEEDTDKIMSTIQKVLSHKERKVFREAIANHTVIERFSEKQFILEASHEYFCPLVDRQGLVSGFIVTSKVDVVGSNLNKKSARSKSHLHEVSI